MAKINRTLIVKSVSYVPIAGGDGSSWVRPLLQDLLFSAFEETKSIGDRHCPPIKDDRPIADGAFCLFVNDYKRLNNGALRFSVCTYTAGHVPESFHPDFNKPVAEFNVVELNGDDGEKGELVSRYTCLAYGDIIVAEAVQGSKVSAGLQRILRSIIRRYSLDKHKHPLVKLNDLILPSLRDFIEDNKGVESMRVAVVGHEVEGAQDFTKTLSSVLGGVGGARRCNVEWVPDKDKTLSSDQAISMLEESSDDGNLAGVSVRLRSGAIINDLSEYQEKRRVSIQLGDDGRPAATSINFAISAYLSDICTAKNSCVDANGLLKSASPLETGG